MPQEIDSIQEFDIIETRRLSLSEWLSLVFNPPDDKRFIDYQFPTEQHREEFLAHISDWSEEQIKGLLFKFLIRSGSLGCDDNYLAELEYDRLHRPEIFNRKMELQFFRRLLRYDLGDKTALPWEGITWILDLLPHFPKEALEGLNAYILAHVQFLPDGRHNGLDDATEIIRARYIGYPGTHPEAIRLLLGLSSRDFEHIVERLYHGMDYDTELTPAQKDGGRDIIATRKTTGKLEHLRVECKQYSNPVDVKIVRALLGVISDEKVNKGAVVTTSRFTKGAKDFADRNPRLELISGDELIPLLNEHLGSRWSLQIERLISESRKLSSKTGEE